MRQLLLRITSNHYISACPAPNVVFNSPDQCMGMVSLNTVRASDNCNAFFDSNHISDGSGSGDNDDRLLITMQFSFTDADLSAIPVGLHNAMYRASDGSGNVAECQVPIEVKDVQLPSIVCPTGITANTGTACNSVVSYAPTFLDNCAQANFEVTCPSGVQCMSGSIFSLGVTTVALTVIDSSMNMANCSFTVTIIEVSLPEIICPSILVKNNDVGQCFFASQH